ncbi:LEM domain-containing protein 1 isoform X2 [Kryptolebias marmoratus]|uniref:LEM domain-containing protein 1 isoform X2 n=1 Tax=Kryptolebias marmoratus TaxID=37003 RepID=UPI0007F8FA1A|nr:LEM domain-containing protein 1 isoform X2 [Kryptolebias marmoratus]
MPFVEDPAHLSKSRLKSGLVANNVELPAADDEDLDAEMSDPSSLTDDDLKAMLLKYGVTPGPIVASTRVLYERKLRKLQSEGHNGAENNVRYSDSEEEEDKESGLEEDVIKVSGQSQQASREADLAVQGGAFVYPQCFLISPRLRACSPGNKESSSKRNAGNALKWPERTVSQRSQIPAGISKTSSIAPRSGLRSGVPSAVPNSCSSFEAFSIAQMVEEMESRRSFSGSSDQEVNGSNVLERRSQSNRLDLQLKDKYTRADKSFYHTPKASRQEQETKVHREPVAEILKDIFPNTNTSPTGIYATPRRPIKGAAQRPVQYAYPDTPVSPVTQERREVERRLVPFKIQIVAFVAVTCVLYLIYVNAEHSGSVMALLESLNQWSD